MESKERGRRFSVATIVGVYRDELLKDFETGPKIGPFHGGIVPAAMSFRGGELFLRTLREFGIRSKTAGQSVKRP